MLFLMRGNASFRCVPGDAYPGPRARVDPPVSALGVPYSSSRIDVLRSAPLGSLAVALSKKSFFDLSVDAMQPLLRPVGFLSISIGFCF